MITFPVEYSEDLPPACRRINGVSGEERRSTAVIGVPPTAVMEESIRARGPSCGRVHPGKEIGWGDRKLVRSNQI